MASIKEYLAQILSARYGKDVRQAIHDSIKDINDIATGAQNSATAAAGKAVEKANEALASSQSASEKANEALESAEQAAVYAKQAETASGIHIASKDIAGVIKPGDFKVEEDGTVWMIKTVAGESMVLNDSVAGGLKIDRICGGCKQEKTSGKQLLEYPYYNNTTTVNGITFTDNGDGSITISGTATAEARFWIRQGVIAVNDGDTVTVSRNKKIDGVVIDGWASDWSSFFTNSALALNDLSQSGAISSNNILLSITVKKGTTVNETIKVMLNASTEPLPWEPYTGGIPSPNPEYPQPIVSAGQMLVDGVVTDVGISKKLTGAQLFDKDNGNYVSEIACNITTKCYGEGVSGCRLYYVDAKPNTTYTLSKSVGSFFRVATSPNEPTRNGVITNHNEDTTKNVATITTGANDRYIAVYTLLESELSSITYEQVMATLMVNEGKEALPYEPYTEQNLTINRVLRGIPVTDASLANYTDADGRMWCADYIDADRGVLVQRVGEIVSDGSDDEFWFKDETLGTTSFSRLLDEAVYFGDGTSTYTICDRFGVTARNYWEESLSDRCMITAHGGELEFINVSMASTLDEWLIWLHENHITAHYILATPIETPLTDEEIIALHQLKTYQGVTHIFGSNDPDATMIFKYSSSEIGGVTLENSNLHAVNEVLRRQLEAKDAELSGQVKELDENISNGMEITDVTQITQGGMYYSNGNVANAPTNDGVYYEYFASKNGWIVSIIARSGSDGATYVSNNGYDGTTWTNKGWHRLITDEDIPYKVVIDDTAGTIDFIDR